MTFFEENNQKAKDAIASGNFNDAIIYLERIKENKSIEIYTNLGVCYSKLKNFNEALKNLEMALLLDNNDQMALANKANILYKIGDYEKSISTYKYLVKTYPQNVDYIENLGIIYLELNRNLEAIECFNLKEKITGKKDDNVINMTNAFIGLNKWNEAFFLLKETTKSQPNNYEAWNNIAIVYINKGEYNLAVDALNRAISIKPDYYLALYNLGKTYLQGQEFEKGIEAISNALKINETQEALFKMAELNLKLKNTEKCIFYLNKAIKLNPLKLQSNYSAGNIYFDLRKYDLAKFYFQRELDLQPEHTGSITNIGIIYSIANDNEKALEYFEKALLLDPHNPSHQKNIQIVRRKLNSTNS